MSARLVLILGLGLALASSGCDLFGATPTPTPATLESVKAAVDHSTMKSGHFGIGGYFYAGANRYNVSGQGDLQRVPDAMEMTMSIPTYTSLGVLQLQQVDIGGKEYSRTGSAKWTSKPQTTSPVSPTVYVGEEMIAADAVWHIQSTGTGTTYDTWVRESDGYIALINFTSANKFTVNLKFNAYNNSPIIVAP